uniref:THAP-type domain-containing protein n=1 Tax=Knipowitschia caucasica TaxID=637954 RepID=A0AAV2M0F8_KNICA
MRVCSLHFHSGKPSYEMLENHPDWTPSLRCCNTPVSDCVEGVQRLFSNSLMMREKSNKGKMPPRKCDMCRVIQGAVLLRLLSDCRVLATMSHTAAAVSRLKPKMKR